MKKFFSIMMVAAIAAISLSSCQQKALDVQETNTVHFIVKAGIPQTKTYIDNQLDGTYLVGWKASDQLAVFFSEIKPALNDKAEYVFENTEEDGPEALFEGDVELSDGDGEFLSFYPASAIAKTYDGTVGVTLKDTQHPTYDSFDATCDILVAKPCYYYVEDGELAIDDLNFKRMFSVIKVNLNSTFSSVSGESVRSFRIEAPSSVVLTGRPAIDLETAEIKKWNISNNYVAADLDDVSVGTELENAVYLLVNPTTIASGSEVTFTAETENYNISKKVTLTKDLVFPQGNIAVINLNILESDCHSKAAPKSLPYEEDFAKSVGAFTINNVNLGGLDHVWSVDTNYGYIKASAYVNAAHATESWIVSPTIDLSNASGAVLTFDQALNKLNSGNREDYVDVLIKVDGQDWQTLTIDAYPAGSDWIFITSSANLYSYVGSKIQLGFKYTSSSSIAPTWEIKNFSVKAPETTLAFDIAEKQIFVGDSFDNVANTNSPATVTYASSNSEVATVGEAGTITGVGVGTCTITASVEACQGYPAKSAVCNVSVQAASTDNWVKTAITGIYPTAKVVIVGGGYAMTNDNGTGSAPAAVAVTTKDDKLTSVVNDNVCWSIGGNATDGYTFYPYGDTSHSLFVNTTVASGSNNNIRVGSSSSDSRKLFAPDDSGYFKTKDSYTARYLSVYKDTPDWRGYANTANNPVVLEFYVLEGSNTPVAVNGVELDKTSASVAVNGTVTLTATVAPANATNKDVTWTSSDESKATVDQNGVVTGVAAGSATITVTTVDGNFMANCAVEVTAGGSGSDEEVLSENFSSITEGDNTTTGGNSSAWSGNDNFPTVSSAYKAGGAVKIGASKSSGSITTKYLDLSSSFTVALDIKGWSSVEGTIIVTCNGVTKEITYSETMSCSFGHYSVDFNAATSTSTVTIATSTKRAFIDNVVITKH